MNTPMICGICHLPLKKTKMGVVVEFTARSGTGQRPYIKASGDRYDCINCGYSIITDYGRPIEHHDPNYNSITADIQVPE